MRRRRQRENDLERELRAHLDLEAAERLGEGLSPRDADFAARRTLGNTALIQEEVRSMWGWTSVEVLWQDARYGLRQLRRTPGFTAIAILALALGIGANTAIFSAMNAALLRYLPVRDPQRLMLLNTTFSFGSQSGDGDTSITEYIFEQLRTHREVFEDLVSFVPISSQPLAVRYGSMPEEAFVEMVSGDFFSGLGVRTARGRGFSLEDEDNHAPVAVLSYEYWAQRHGGDGGVLGHQLLVNGVSFTVVGVAAPDFAGVENRKATDIWIPLQRRAELQPWGQSADSELSLYGASHTWWCLKMIGRLRPGITTAAALARLQPVFQNAALDGTTRDPKLDRPKLYFTPVRGIEGMKEAYQEPLTVLMIMVGLVLLIACANVATLLVARNLARSREFSLRMAIGGSRLRLFRQLLTESLLLAAAGGALGWFFALRATRALAVWTDLNMSLEPDGSVLAFTMGVSLGAGIFFSLAPLRGVFRTAIGVGLKAPASAAGSNRQRFHAGRFLVPAQIAMCLVLLVGAGLLVETLRHLQDVDLGIRSRGLLVFGVTPRNLHSDGDAVRFYEMLLPRMRALPGVEAATVMQYRLGSGWSSNSTVRVDGAGQKDSNVATRVNLVGSGYFAVMGTPVLLGRDIAESDTATSPRVVVINQTFAERFLPGRSPLGHSVEWARYPAATIVGVSRDSKYTGVREESRPMAWFPYTQVKGIAGMEVELRTAGNPAALLPEVRRSLAQFAPDLGLLQPMTQQEQFEASYSEGRLLARLGIFFGLLASLLVATGLYGTLSYSVGRRTSEVGIRMALGAQRRQVLWMVFRTSLMLAAAGIAIGIPLAVFASRFLRTVLFGVQPGNPVIFAAALGGILLVALGASLVPARRAASVDPMVALRQE
jgi:predicted permease